MIFQSYQEFTSGRYSSAAELMGEALQAARSLSSNLEPGQPYSPLQAEALIYAMLAPNSFAQEKFDEGFAYANKSLSLLKKDKGVPFWQRRNRKDYSGNRVHDQIKECRVQAYVSIGVVHQHRGQNIAALEAYLKALRLASASDPELPKLKYNIETIRLGMSKSK